jgi:ATP-dependent Clp protease ATP-binding subunit ClpA
MTQDEPAPINPLPTERFQRVLAFASDEADGLGHGFVTCQHLLYALTRENKGLASAVLESLGVTPDGLHDFLADSAASHDRTAEGRIDLADESRDALDRAVRAAREWGHRAIDTEHILYGIVAAQTSADDMFIALHVSPNDVLASLNYFQQNAPPAAIRDEATHAYRFTLESAWLLSFATDTARRQGVARVSNLHLLAAMLSQPGPVKEVLVGRLGVSPDGLAQHITGYSMAAQPAGRLPLGDDVQRALGYSIGEAWNRGHLAVSPLHMAMGIARTERNPALDALAELGVSQADLIDALDAAMPPQVTR